MFREFQQDLQSRRPTIVVAPLPKKSSSCRADVSCIHTYIHFCRQGLDKDSYERHARGKKVHTLTYTRHEERFSSSNDDDDVELGSALKLKEAYFFLSWRRDSLETRMMTKSWIIHLSGHYDLSSLKRLSLPFATDFLCSSQGSCDWAA